MDLSSEMGSFLCISHRFLEGGSWQLACGLETLYSFIVVGENFGILEKLHVGSAFEDYLLHEI